MKMSKTTALAFSLFTLRRPLFRQSFSPFFGPPLAGLLFFRFLCAFVFACSPPPGHVDGVSSSLAGDRRPLRRTIDTIRISAVKAALSLCPF